LLKLREAHHMKLRAAGRPLKDLVLTGSGPLLARAAAACEPLGIQFNKGSVAKLIRSDLVAMQQLPPALASTGDKARQLFAAITAGLVA
jgi:hypothetical protein